MFCFPEITERIASLKDVWKLSPGLAVINAITFKWLRRTIILRSLRILVKAFIRSLDLAPVDHKYIMNLPKDAKSPYPYKHSRIYIQRSGANNMNDVPDDTYLTGYWESEQYFSDFSDIVRKKFRFSPECFDPALTEQVRSCNSVAVHVRRGDKVEDDDSQASNLPYLSKALPKMDGMTENPEFFVFSDDTEWCKANLHKAYKAEYHFVEGQAIEQDMALMTQCKHVVMGPSTFSWWGAWLNENPNKIILVPDRKINMRWYPKGAILID